MAFVDSDCTVPAGWLSGLTWLFDDPSIGAVAPRVRPAGAPHPHRARVVDRYGDARSALDLGPDEGEVGPDRAVRYVPTAALVARREAVAAVGGFDPGMRVGEDVDLVWRLVEAGWRVRYQPEVAVAHAEPGRWSTLAGPPGPLRDVGRPPGRPASRSPGPGASCARCPPWPRWRPWSDGPSSPGRPWRCRPTLLARTVRPLGVPGRQAWALVLQGAGWTVVGLGRAATMLACPGPGRPGRTGHRGARAGPGAGAGPPGRGLGAGPARSRPAPLGGRLGGRRPGLRDRRVAGVPAGPGPGPARARGALRAGPGLTGLRSIHPVRSGRIPPLPPAGIGSSDVHHHPCNRSDLSHRPGAVRAQSSGTIHLVEEGQICTQTGGRYPACYFALGGW